MEQLSDLRLGNFTEILGPQTLFHNGSENLTSVSIQTPATGAGKVIAYSGSAASDFGGFFLADRVTKQRIAAIRNGASIDAEEMGKLRILLDAEYGNAVIGGNGKDGDLVLRNETGETMLHFSSGLGVEGNHVHRTVAINARFKYLASTGVLELRGPLGGRQQLFDSAGTRKIDLNGQDGKGHFMDVQLSQGTDYIPSLLAKIKQLETRIAALEARP